MAEPAVELPAADDREAMRRSAGRPLNDTKAWGLADRELLFHHHSQRSDRVGQEEAAGLGDGTPIIVDGLAPSARGDRGLHVDELADRVTGPAP